jgi:IS5 family transposase
VSRSRKRLPETEANPPPPTGGGGFADRALVVLHCLRIYLNKSYRETLDLLSEMPRIVGQVGLTPADLPDFTTLCKAFDRLKMAVWRALLRHSADLFDGSGHAAIDSTGFDRHHASRHYSKHLDYTITALKTTAVVDTETQAVLDVHCTTKRRHDTQIGLQVARRIAGDLQSLAGDKGYDWQKIRKYCRSTETWPLIKHREFTPLDLAHNAKLDDERYGQRWMCETVFSVIKRSLGFAVRARTWYRQFRETMLTFAVYNVKRSLKQ